MCRKLRGETNNRRRASPQPGPRRRRRCSLSFTRPGVDAKREMHVHTHTRGAVTLAPVSSNKLPNTWGYRRNLQADPARPKPHTRARLHRDASRITPRCVAARRHDRGNLAEESVITRTFGDALLYANGAEREFASRRRESLERITGRSKASRAASNSSRRMESPAIYLAFVKSPSSSGHKSRVGRHGLPILDRSDFAL